MTTKDIIIIFVLIVILAIVLKMQKTNKAHAELLTAVAIKTGAMDELPKPKSSPKHPGLDGYEDDEEEDEDNAKEPKKVKLKKTQKQTVSLFSDGIPKQIGELRDLYMGRFSDIDKVKFYNTLYNLKPSNTLNFEKIDNKNYWGLGDWFDQDGSLYEEYADKIEGSTKLTILKNE